MSQSIASDKTSVKPSSRDALMCRKTAATWLGLSEQTLAHWASTGKERLPYIKFSTRVMYRVGDILDFIECNRVAPSAD